MPAARLNGIRAHYESHGEGDLVLLIDGRFAPLGELAVPYPNRAVENVNRAVPGFLRGVMR